MTRNTPCRSCGFAAGTLALSCLWAVALATPVAAGEVETRYAATLEHPARQGSVAAGGIVWICKDTACAAKAGEGQPIDACRSLAQRAGKVTMFGVGGTALPTDDLRRCNRPAPPPSDQRVFPPRH